ncbi:hypothetical protein FRC11_014999 [Ceratobasidium sp. 423]|nr:hypothetical protein FRC11_014999 [Ceratobasidium sp. 423]
MYNQPYRPTAPHGTPGSGYGGRGYTKGTKPVIIGHRVGGWLPKDHRIIERYIAKLLQIVEKDKRALHKLSPSIVRFKHLVDTTPALRKGFSEMFEQVPRKPPYNQDPTLKPQASYLT